MSKYKRKSGLSVEGAIRLLDQTQNLVDSHIAGCKAITTIPTMDLSELVVLCRNLLDNDIKVYEVLHGVKVN